MDFRVPPLVAKAVARTAIETGVAKIKMDPELIAQQTRTMIYEGELENFKGTEFVLKNAR